MPGYQPKQRSPWTLTLIVGGHAAALAALALFKMAPPELPGFKPIETKNIPLDPPPPPEPRPVDKSADKPSQVPSVPDNFQTPLPSDNPLPPRPMPPEPAPPLADPVVPIGPTDIPLPPPPAPGPLPTPRPDPVRVEAERDPRYAGQFQPPYPDIKQAQGEEGRAVVRVLIGTDGRVKQVEPVSATDPAFASATARHARARWRFRPATVDGAPVESWKRITVTFTLND